MASANYEKFHTPREFKAMLMHGDKFERPKHEHNNKQIDKKLTPYNIQYMGMRYKDACVRFDKRLQWLDSQPNANKRKDRVVGFGIEIPCPQALEDKGRQAEEQFFKRAFQIISEQYGRENIVGAYYHVDEKHPYPDAETGKQRISLHHAHFYVIPEIDGKLNGKAFSSRNNMRKLNAALHAMCQKEFGVDFMDGSQRKSTDSVETLKAKSREQEQKQLTEALKMRLADLDEREAHQNAREKALDEQEAHQNAREKALDKREQELQAREQEAVTERSRTAESRRIYEEATEEVWAIARKYHAKQQEEEAREVEKELQPVAEKTAEAIRQAQASAAFAGLQKWKRDADERERDAEEGDFFDQLLRK